MAVVGVPPLSQAGNHVREARVRCFLVEDEAQVLESLDLEGLQVAVASPLLPLDRSHVVRFSEEACLAGEILVIAGFLLPVSWRSESWKARIRCRGALSEPKAEVIEKILRGEGQQSRADDTIKASNPMLQQ